MRQRINGFITLIPELAHLLLSMCTKYAGVIMEQYIILTLLKPRGPNPFAYVLQWLSLQQRKTQVHIWDSWTMTINNINVKQVDITLLLLWPPSCSSELLTMPWWNSAYTTISQSSVGFDVTDDELCLFLVSELLRLNEAPCWPFIALCSADGPSVRLSQQ